MSQPSTRLIDFDAFRAERAKSEPVVVLVGGREWLLPADLPALVALDALRLQEGMQDGDVDPAVLVTATRRIAEALFGEVQLEEMLRETEMSLIELSDLMGRILSAYSAGVVPPPNRETRRAASGTRSASAGRS